MADNLWLSQQEFEFFGAFSPLVERAAAMQTCTFLVNTWLHSERETLFLLAPHSWPTQK